MTTRGPTGDNASGARGGTVLLVDDDDMVRKALEIGLTRCGFEVVAAASGEAGLEILRSERKLDFLLTDVVMGQLSGLDLARDCRRLRPALPILLMTGYAFELAGGFGAAREEFPVLGKPCSVRVVAARIFDMMSAPAPGPASRGAAD